MVNNVTTLSTYISKSQTEKNLIAHLERLSKKRERLIDYLVVKVIAQFLDREEQL